MLLASSQLIFCFLLIFLCFSCDPVQNRFSDRRSCPSEQKAHEVQCASDLPLLLFSFFLCLSIVSTSYSFDNGNICFVSFMIRPSFSSQNASILSSATFRSLLFAPKHTISSTYRTPYFYAASIFRHFPGCFPFSLCSGDILRCLLFLFRFPDLLFYVMI